jgi:hypothetical protein
VRTTSPAAPPSASPASSIASDRLPAGQCDHMYQYLIWSGVNHLHSFPSRIDPDRRLLCIMTGHMVPPLPVVHSGTLDNVSKGTGHMSRKPTL